MQQSTPPLNIIVTGATGAIGSEAAAQLRLMGHRVIPTSRRAEHEGFYPLDISSPRSITAFVQRIADEGIRIDALLNNAGTILPQYSTTPEGFETVTATNYLGTYLLTRQLMPLFNPMARVVCTISLSCHIAHLDRSFFDITPDRYNQIGVYANSKMAVLLFAEELHRRYADRLRVNVTDPGVVNSRMLTLHRWFDPLADLLFRPFTKSPQKGAIPAVAALTTDEQMQLFRGSSHSSIPRRWQQSQLAQWLWDETERRLSPYMHL